MINVSFSFDEDRFRRKSMDAAEKQVRANSMEGDYVRFQFSGDDEAVKKAKAIFER